MTAYCTFGLALGWKPLFELPAETLKLLTFDNPMSLFSYTLLALFMVVLAMIYTRRFYSFTFLFRRMTDPAPFPAGHRRLFDRGGRREFVFSLLRLRRSKCLI